MMAAGSTRDATCRDTAARQESDGASMVLRTSLRHGKAPRHLVVLDDERVRPMTSLAQRLRDETRDLHTVAERSGIMRPLLRGTLAPGDYGLLLRNLHDIYVAMECGLNAHRGLPALAPFAHAGLARAPRIAYDLDVIVGPGWHEVLVAPTTQQYASRLGVISVSNPVLLLAHAYVRYLGDLSGGQQIARCIRRVLPADMTGATAFYEFPDLADLEAFKHGVRAALDAVELPEDVLDGVAAEARWSFHAHAALFNELAVATGIAELQGEG